jgi:membrane protein required for colicin V production
MNSFDVVVLSLLLVAATVGFRSGLLRSLATILGYLLAMPFAMVLAPYISTAVVGRTDLSFVHSSLLLFGTFMVAGMLFGALARSAVSEAIGPEIGAVDRTAGAMLGAVRVLLVAVTLVLMFDQLIPGDRQPAFLAGSRLRPVLSVAAQQGLKSLPPDVTALIAQLKRDGRI